MAMLVSMLIRTMSSEGHQFSVRVMTTDAGKILVVLCSMLVIQAVLSNILMTVFNIFVIHAARCSMLVIKSMLHSILVTQGALCSILVISAALRSIVVSACQNVVAVSRGNLVATTPTVAGGDINAADQVEDRAADYQLPTPTMFADDDLTMSADNTSTPSADSASVDVVSQTTAHHNDAVDTRDTTTGDVADGTHHPLAVVQPALAGHPW